jgi:uncharacterized protein with HXXEE motif
MNTVTLIWLFPIAFTLHDFEEIIFFEPWLKRNAGELRGIIEKRAPVFLRAQLHGILEKPATELSATIALIFLVTIISSVLAITSNFYFLFLLTSGMFFLHGFGHVAQSVALRKYVPGAITSVVIVIPYGLILCFGLINDAIVGGFGLFACLLFSAVLLLPFILIMHRVGSFLYVRGVGLLVD